MGEARKEALRVGIDSRIKLEFHGAAITSDAGLVAYRELDVALSLTEMADEVLRDSRQGQNTQHELVGLLRHTEPNTQVDRDLIGRHQSPLAGGLGTCRICLFSRDLAGSHNCRSPESDNSR